MQCSCCISKGNGFHSGHRSPHAALYSPPPPQHIVHQGFTYSLSPAPAIAQHAPQGHHLHMHPVNQPHTHQPQQVHAHHHAVQQQQQHQAVRASFGNTPTQCLSPLQRRALFTHSPCRHCTSPMAPSPTGYMRVVSPLHVASPQLHSPEVSSTVSTPAAVDRAHPTHSSVHHQPVVVQGFRSVGVATCALSNSDTESDCSSEVAQINVFKDPNRFLPANRIPIQRDSLEKEDTGCTYNPEGENGEEEEQDDFDHIDDIPSDTVSDSRPLEVSKEVASELSVEGTEKPSSAQQEQVVEGTSKVVQTRKKATNKPKATGNKRTTTRNKPTTTVNKPAAGNKFTAAGNKSTPAGKKSTTTGDKSTTPGNKSTTPGNKSTTTGSKSTTTGDKSTPAGDKSTTAEKKLPGESSLTIAGNRSTTTKSKPTSVRNRRKSPRLCMPRKSQARKVKVEIVTDGDDDDDTSEAPVVPFLETPQDAHEMQNSPLTGEVGDEKVAVSTRARKKRHWHNKSLSLDEEEEEDNHKPGSAKEVGRPKKASAKESATPSSSQQGAEKSTEKQSPVKNEQHLQNWYFHVCGSFVIVEGERIDDGSNTIWHSGPIVEREGPYRIKTKSGSIYVLHGAINSQLTIERGAHASLVMKFKKGFPEDWEQLLQKYFKSFRNVRSMKRKSSSGKTNGVAAKKPLSTEPQNDGNTSSSADVSVKRERGKHQQQRRSSAVHSVESTASSPKEIPLPHIKQDTTAATPSTERPGEQEANSSVRRSTRGRVIKARGMKVDYDFYGNIRSLEELDSSVGSDTSMYLERLQQKKVKRESVTDSSTQQSSRSSAGGRNVVPNRTQRDQQMKMEADESASHVDEMVAQKRKRGRPRRSVRDLAEGDPLPAQPEIRISARLDDSMVPLKKRRKGRPRERPYELTEEEDSDGHIVTDPLPARPERRTSARLKDKVLSKGQRSHPRLQPKELAEEEDSDDQIKPKLIPARAKRRTSAQFEELTRKSQSSLCKTPQESCRNLPSRSRAPVSGRRVRFSDVHELGPHGSTTYSLGDTTPSTSAGDTEEEEDRAAEDEEERSDMDEECEGEEGRQNEGDRGNGEERERIARADNSAEDLATDEGGEENSAESEEATDHTDSDQQETSVDHQTQFDNAINQVVVEIADLARKQHHSDSLPSDNPLDGVYVKNDPRRRSHRVRKSPNRGNVINWDFLAGVRGIPLNDQLLDGMLPRKRGRPPKSGAMQSLTPQRCKHKESVTLDSESEDASFSTEESFPAKKEHLHHGRQTEVEGKVPQHSQKGQAPGAEGRPKRRGRPPLHSRGGGSSSSRQGSGSMTSLTLPAQELTQSDMSTEEEEESRPWSQEDHDLLLRVVSKVPATSPNFWHVVAKNLQLGYSAEECQQVYQGLVPSLPTAVVGKKTKKNDWTPVVVTGKKGTLKRKAQLQELILRTEMGYSDDLLDLTPFREKTIRVPAAQSDSEEDWEDAGVSTTPLHTPANSLKKLMKVPSQNTPTLCDVLDTPDFRAQTSRMEADRKVYQLQKAQKRHGGPGRRAKAKAAVVHPKQSMKWSKQIATLAASQGKVAAQLDAARDQDSEEGSSDHYCSNLEEGEDSDMDLF